MKSHLIKIIRRLAVLSCALVLAIPAQPQSGTYTVKVLNPALDTVIRICPGQGYNFRAECYNDDGSPFDDDQVDYVWRMGGQGPVLPGNAPSYAFPEGGHYLVKLTVRGKEGPDAINSPEIHVFVSMAPYFTGTRPNDQSLCSGDELILSGFVTPVPWVGDGYPFENEYLAADFRWDGMGIITNQDGIARINPPRDQGHLDYLFRVKDDFGCFFDTAFTLNGVEAEFTMEPKTGEAPLEVKFQIKDPSNGGFESNISYEFEFYEQQDSNNLIRTTELQHIFDNPGVYLPRMIAKYNQCTYRFAPEEEVIRVDSSLLEIPNVFTPNGDGFNDYFQVSALSLKTFKGVIFNRWGRVLFEWDDPKTLESGWDGLDRNSGKEAPVGTYYYVITATGYDRDRSKDPEDSEYPHIEYRGGVYKGSLMLFR